MKTNKKKNTDEKKWYKVEFYTTTPEEVSESVLANLDIEVDEITVGVSNPEKQGDWEIETLVRRGLGIEHLRYLPDKIYVEPESSVKWITFHMESQLRQLEKQTRLDTARRIAEVAQEAGLVPKDLANVTDWKEAVEIIKKQTRESVIEEVARQLELTVLMHEKELEGQPPIIQSLESKIRAYIRHQLKQKTKE